MGCLGGIFWAIVYAIFIVVGLPGEINDMWPTPPWLECLGIGVLALGFLFCLLSSLVILDDLKKHDPLDGQGRYRFQRQKKRADSRVERACREWMEAYDELTALRWSGKAGWGGEDNTPEYRKAYQEYKAAEEKYIRVVNEEATSRN